MRVSMRLAVRGLTGFDDIGVWFRVCMRLVMREPGLVRSEILRPEIVVCKTPKQRIQACQHTCSCACTCLRAGTHHKQTLSYPHALQYATHSQHAQAWCTDEFGPLNSMRQIHADRLAFAQSPPLLNMRSPLLLICSAAARHTVPRLT